MNPPRHVEETSSRFGSDGSVSWNIPGGFQPFEPSFHRSPRRIVEGLFATVGSRCGGSRFERSTRLTRQSIRSRNVSVLVNPDGIQRGKRIGPSIGLWESIPLRPDDKNDVRYTIGKIHRGYRVRNRSTIVLVRRRLLK